MFRALAAALVLAALPARAGDRVPVLVELFTSEGCSSCPAADDLLARLVRDQPVHGVEILAPSEHVDYWDSLGWKDPYSSAVFTERQQLYASRLRRGGIYTPQAVIDGRAEVVGSDEAAAAGRVARGENAGRTLSHVRVVRELRRIGGVDQGAWSGEVQLGAREARLRLVAFVQERSSGRVLASGSWSAQ